MGEGSAANAAKVVSSEPHGATVTRFDKLIPVPVVRLYRQYLSSTVLEFGDARPGVIQLPASPSSRWSRIVVAKNDGPAAGRLLFAVPRSGLKTGVNMKYSVLPAHASIGGWVAEEGLITQPRERRSSSRAALLHGGRRGCNCWRRLGLLLCSSRRPCISPTAAAAVNLFCARHEGFQRGGGGGGRGL